MSSEQLGEMAADCCSARASQLSPAQSGGLHSSWPLETTLGRPEVSLMEAGQHCKRMDNGSVCNCSCDCDCDCKHTSCPPIGLTMETDDSFEVIMNQCTESAEATALAPAARTRNKSTITARAASYDGGNNSNIQPTGSRHVAENDSAMGPAVRRAIDVMGRQLTDGETTRRCRQLTPAVGHGQHHLSPSLAISRPRHPRAPSWSSGSWIKSRSSLLVLSVHLCSLLSVACLVQAGFWTFYFPNFLKASGYSELSDMIHSVEKQINATKDAHADAIYFWNFMKLGPNSTNGHAGSAAYYPEESVCDDVFPMFRDLAIEYAAKDYEYFLTPLEQYRDHLLTSRETWYPDGSKSKRILPREFEQSLYKVDLELRLQSYNHLVSDPNLRRMRDELVNIWTNVKRSLDSSLACVYLRYSYRHIAEDINQFALEMNLKSLEQAKEMLDSAYKRLALFKDQDDGAIVKIKDDMERERHLVID